MSTSRIAARRGRKHILLLASLLFGLGSADLATAQINAGASYLKIIPGTRQIGIAGALTGSLDNMSALYANPGATSVLREWQWSASYTSWIPGIDNISFFYGRGVRLPWARWARTAFSVSYLGIKEFDSTNGKAPPGSGGDVLATLSYGQPLSAISRWLHFGGSAKFLHSNLDNSSTAFRASTFGFDVGLLLRTPQFDLIPGFALFDRAILSVGGSITNMGSGLKYDFFETPLPRTRRLGLALNTGLHGTIQAQLAADYRNIRDERDYFSIGIEVLLWRMISLRTGYDSEDNNLLGHTGIGLSLGLEDVMASGLTGRNNALRADFAWKPEENVFNDNTVRLSGNHFPLRPESFRFMDFASDTAAGDLTNGAMQTAANGVDLPTFAACAVDLVWEETRDPDLLDEVRYMFLADTSLAAIEASLAEIRGAGLLARFGESTDPAFPTALAARAQAVRQLLSEPLHTLNAPAAWFLNTACRADVYWTVIAFDSDMHYRIINGDTDNIRHVRLQAPVSLTPEITRIEYDPARSDSAALYVSVRNTSAQPASNVLLSAYQLPLVAGGAQPVRAPLPAPPVRVSVEGGGTATTRIAWRPGPAAPSQLSVGINEDMLACACPNPYSLDLYPDLGLEKTASQSEFTESDTLVYMLKVRNTGNWAALNATLVDSIPLALEPFGFDPTPADVSMTESHTIVTWALPNVGVGAMVPVSYSAKLRRARRETMSIPGINFSNDSSVLRRADKEALRTFAAMLESRFKSAVFDSIVFSGHTSSPGDSLYNEGLSQRRALAVRKFLLDSTRFGQATVVENIVVRGFGERQPLEPDDTSGNRAERRRKQERNRRVEIGFHPPLLPIVDEITNRAHVRATGDPDDSNNHAEYTVRGTQKPLLAPPPRLNSIEFGFDRDILTGSSRDSLNVALENLRKIVRFDTTAIYEIAGHTDCKGDSLYNLDLSARRARTALNYLLDRERTLFDMYDDTPLNDLAARGKLISAGYGEREPVAPNCHDCGLTSLDCPESGAYRDCPTGRLWNRRVEFRMNGAVIGGRLPTSVCPDATN